MKQRIKLPHEEIIEKFNVEDVEEATLKQIPKEMRFNIIKEYLEKMTKDSDFKCYPNQSSNSIRVDAVDEKSAKNFSDTYGKEFISFIKCFLNDQGFNYRDFNISFVLTVEQNGSTIIFKI